MTREDASEARDVGVSVQRSEWLEDVADEGAGRMSNPQVAWAGEGWHSVSVAISVMPRHRFLRAELDFDLGVMDALITSAQAFDPEAGAALAARVGFPPGYVLDRDASEAQWSEPTYELYRAIDDRFLPVSYDERVLVRWLRPSQQMLVRDRGERRMWGRYYLVPRWAAPHLDCPEIDLGGMTPDDVLVVEVPESVAQRFGDVGPELDQAPPLRTPTIRKSISKPRPPLNKGQKDDR